MRNKPHLRKVLLNSFDLNVTLGFHPQAQKVEPPCATYYRTQIVN